jgi:Tryptophan halogenase
MKIAMLGSGTASAIALLTFYTLVKENKIKTPLEFYCVYDPAISVTTVGESMPPAVTSLLFDAINFNPITEMVELDATERYGSKYYWTPAHGNDFYIRYKGVGFHANSEKLSAYIIKRLGEIHNNFHVIEDKIVNISSNLNNTTVTGTKGEYTFDLVFNVLGTPSADELKKDYLTPEFQGVNAVLIHADHKNYEEKFTSAYVHDRGWMFGVPLTTRKAFGYAYNTNFCSTADAEKAFSELKNIDGTKTRHISWSQYYRKQAMENSMVYLGNKVYFFEPHQALPLAYTINLVSAVITALQKHQDLNKIIQEVNSYHLTAVGYMQDLIAMNYVGENKFNNKYWRWVKQAAKDRLSKSPYWKEFVRRYKANGGRCDGFYIHADVTMQEYVDGYKINLNDF